MQGCRWWRWQQAKDVDRATSDSLLLQSVIGGLVEGICRYSVAAFAERERESRGGDGLRERYDKRAHGFFFSIFFADWIATLTPRVQS